MTETNELAVLVNYVADELRQSKAVTSSMDAIVSNYIMIRAQKELAEEAFRQNVEAEKVRLRERQKHWFPWRIKFTIERR